MGKTRDLFKKIRDTKGNFHMKIGTIKVRNSMDLTEVEDIKKRWKEYTGELKKKKKDLMTQITHLQPDSLECKVQWALESITTPGVTSVFFWSCDSDVGDSLEFNQANRGSLRV